MHHFENHSPNEKAQGAERKAEHHKLDSCVHRATDGVGNRLSGWDVFGVADQELRGEESIEGNCHWETLIFISVRQITSTDKSTHPSG